MDRRGVFVDCRHAHLSCSLDGARSSPTDFSQTRQVVPHSQRRSVDEMYSLLPWLHERVARFQRPTTDSEPDIKVVSDPAKGEAFDSSLYGNKTTKMAAPGQWHYCRWLLSLVGIGLTGATTPLPSSSLDPHTAAQRLIEALSVVARGEATQVKDDGSLDQEMQLVFGSEWSQQQKQKQQPMKHDENDNQNDSTIDTRLFKDRDDTFYADRYVADMLEILHDPDCMSGSLDASSADFDKQQVVQRLKKCGLVHVQHAISRQILEPYKKNVTSYMKGLMNGRISSQGKTTFGENYFIHETSRHRYDLCFPPDLLNEDVMAHPLILDVVSDRQMIGYVSVCNVMTW